MRFLRLLNLVLSAITILAYAAPYTSPNTGWMVYIPGVGFSWLLIVHLFFMVGWAWRRKIYWIISAATLLLGAENVLNTFGTAMSNATEAPNLRVLTFNMHIPSTDYERMSAKRTKEINDFFKTSDADIICLQEVAILNRVAKDRITQLGLLKRYPYYHKTEKIANVILSKYPIESSGSLPLGDYGNGCIYADINLDGQQLRVYNMHLHSNRITDQTNHMLDVAKNANRPSVSEVRSVTSKVVQRAETRAQQANVIAQHANKFGKTHLICGDMNETPVSYIYNTLAKNHTDAFRMYGFGLGSTYAGNIPFLRIDYLLSSPQLTVLAYEKLHPGFSDHYPVMAGYHIGP